MLPLITAAGIRDTLIIPAICFGRYVRLSMCDKWSMGELKNTKNAKKTIAIFHKKLRQNVIVQKIVILITILVQFLQKIMINCDFMQFLAISHEKTALTRNFFHKKCDFYLQLYAKNAIQ